MTTLEVGNALATHCLYHMGKKVGHFESRLENIVGRQHAFLDRAVISRDFWRRLAERGAARHVGAIVPEAATDIEADQVAALELTIGRLHVDDGAAGAEPDAADHGCCVVLCETGIESPQHLA